MENEALRDEVSRQGPWAARKVAARAQHCQLSVVPHLSLIALVWLGAGAAESVPADLPLYSVDGSPTTLASFRGRIVLLDIWATWCEGCEQALESYNDLHDALSPRGLTIVAVNIDKKDSDVKSFLGKHPLRYRVLRDPKGALAKALKVETMPVSFTVERDGRILARHEGFKRGDAARLRAELEQLLSAEPAHVP